MAFVFLYKIFLPPKTHLNIFGGHYEFVGGHFDFFPPDSWSKQKVVETKWFSFFHKLIRSALKVSVGGGWETPINIITLHSIELH